MSNDLDNLMKKLKKNNPKIEEPEEAEIEEIEEDEMNENEEIVEDDEDLDEEEDDEEELIEEKPKTMNPIKKKVPKEDPKSDEFAQQQLIENELLLLQNPAIYRREKLALLKEQNDLLKVIAQIFLEAKKMFMTNEEDGKGKKKG